MELAGNLRPQLRRERLREGAITEPEVTKLTHFLPQYVYAACLIVGSPPQGSLEPLDRRDQRTRPVTTLTYTPIGNKAFSVRLESPYGHVLRLKSGVADTAPETGGVTPNSSRTRLWSS